MGAFAHSNEGSLVFLVGSELLHLRLPSIVDPSPSWRLRSEWLIPVPPPLSYYEVFFGGIYILSSPSSLSNVKSFWLLCHQDCLAVVHWHAQPAHRRSGETIIVSIVVSALPFLLVPLSIPVRSKCTWVLCESLNVSTRSALECCMSERIERMKGESNSCGRRCAVDTLPCYS